MFGLDPELRKPSGISHSCVPRSHSPESTPQVIDSACHVGWILAADRQSALVVVRFLPLETFPPGIASRSCERAAKAEQRRRRARAPSAANAPAVPRQRDTGLG